MTGGAALRAFKGRTVKQWKTAFRSAARSDGTRNAIHDLIGLPRQARS